jgi:phosphohistidine phosphatase
MKKLIFVRHGKAEEESGISDFERSLTQKGKVVSGLMAHKLAEIEKSPGTIVTSPAFRALETALIFAGEYGLSADSIVLNSDIYYKMNLKNLNHIISGISKDEETVTLFGHNPSFTELANRMSEEGCDFIPKSGIVCISFNVVSWQEIGRNAGKLEYFLIPEKIL